MSEPFIQRITKEALALLPQKHYEGPIVLISDVATFSQHAAVLRNEPILGFDTESKPTFRSGDRHPVSLMQLATQSAVYLLQVSNPGVLLAATALLSNPAQRKVGIAIHDDIKALSELQRFEAKGFVELAQITRKLGIVNTGLRNLTAIILKIRISKSAQMSDWSSTQLSPSQKLYAATDAWAAREIYRKLSALGHV